jgi:predicted GNAT family acetyltransferase
VTKRRGFVPASDAPANTVVTGTRRSSAAVVRGHRQREASQFELVVDGQAAVLTYERTPTSLVLVHTEVPPSLRGRHLGDALAKAAIDAAHAERLRLVVVCPFVKAYLRKQSHRDTTDRKGSDEG